MFLNHTLCIVLSLLAALTTVLPASAQDHVLAAYGCFIWSETAPHVFAKPWANDFDLREDFPERKPLAGWYDDTQQRFDEHLKAISASGLDVIIIDWYDDGLTKEEDAWINNGTRFFMASDVQTDAKFCLSLINHDPFSLKADADWERSLAQWLEAFQHPRYWKVDGKPVMTVHSTWHMERDGEGVEGVAKRVAWLRARVKAAGYPGLLLGGGSDKVGDRVWWDRNLKLEGFDFMTYYNRVGWEAQRDQLSKDRDTTLPYTELIREHTDLWERYKIETDVPLVPCVTVQWDPSPWWGSSPAHSIRYAPPTDDELRGFVAKGKALIDTDPHYRIPTCDGRGLKVLLFCAWNELAEGSYLAPTRGEGDRRMSIIREVFGR